MLDLCVNATEYKFSLMKDYAVYVVMSLSLD